MLLSDFEKEVYNNYLLAFTKANNKPYKKRINFDNLEKDKIDNLKKLSLFLKNHANINYDLFFYAPYKIYSDKKYYELEYFNRPIALKTYFLYLNFLNFESPDNENNLQFIKESIIFIRDFCLEKNIDLNNYLSYTDCVTYNWCVHLMKNKISFYSILGFSYFDVNIYRLINDMPIDEREMFLDVYVDKTAEYMKNLNNSKKAKILIIKGYEKVKEVLKNNLK
jgi:hypothetical protein